MKEEKSYLEQLDSGDVTVVALEKAEKDLKRHQDLLINIKREWEVKQKEFALLVDNARILEPKFKYQELDAYWDIQNDYRELERERQQLDFEDKLAQLTKVIKAKFEEVERLKGEMK